MVWRESGGPAVATPARKGFGSTLIEKALQQEQGRWSYGPALLSGAYEARMGDVVQRLAVNVDPRESDLTRFDPDLLPRLSEDCSRAVMMLRTHCDHDHVDATGRQQSLHAVPHQRAAT